MRLLVFSFGGIGNTLLLTPSLKCLRAHFPQAQMAVLVMFQGSCDLLKNNPIIDELLLWKFIEENPWKSFFFLLKLRRRHFDISIMGFPANRWQYNLISWLVGAKRRLGHRYLHRDRRNFNFLHTDTLVEDDRFHDAEENLRLLSRLGIPQPAPPRLELFLTLEEKQFAERWLSERTLLGKGLVGFHAGSSLFKNHLKKRWSPEKFAALAKRLIDQCHYHILLFGTREDEEANRKIVEAVPGGIHRVEGMSMTETAALVNRCLVMVTNDTSLLQVAAALSIPTVAIFGPTRVTRVQPFQTRHRIVRKDLSCSPCFYYSPKPLTCYRPERDYACLNWIETNEVLEATLSLLGQSSPSRDRYV